MMHMKLNEYQELSKRTMPEGNSKEISANYAMGLTGEAGEVSDILKKWVFHGHDMSDKSELEKELGDVLHYLSGLATLHGLRLTDVAETNIEKLKRRYPEGFSEEASRERVE